MMTKHYKTKEIAKLEEPFYNIVSSCQICKGNGTFHIEDLLRLYIKRTSQLPHRLSGALNDVAYNFPKDFINPREESAQANIKKLCRFFLLDTPITIVDLAIRSMMRCLKMNPFVMSHYNQYSEFLLDVENAKHSLKPPFITDPQYEALFRAASIILMLNDNVFLTDDFNAARAILRHVNTTFTSDLPFVTVFTQYVCRQILYSDRGIFSSNSLVNKDLVLHLLKAINSIASWQHLSGINREYTLANFFLAIAPPLRHEKDIIMQSVLLYPNTQIFIPYNMTEYVPASLRKDPDVAKMLHTRQDTTSLFE